MAVSRGWCMKHYHRWREYGDPEAPFRKPGKKRADSTIRNGYVAIYVGDTQVKEHRHIMSQMLGRPLTSYEEVHHKNTLRHDNRPENLELWFTGSQPPGGRVEDIADWAHWFLSQYRPETLKDPDPATEAHNRDN